MKILLLAVASLALCSCDAIGKALAEHERRLDEEVKTVVESQGYTQVQSLGAVYAGCSETDTERRGFRAMGANAIWIEGVACSSASKGWTVRVTGAARPLGAR